MENMKIIALGMGVQSTALWLMSSLGYIKPRADYAIFADTGAEKTATIEYFNNLNYDNYIPLIKVNYKNIYKDLMKGENSSGNRFASIPAFSENGGMLRRQCTSEYKINQVDKKIRELYGLKKNQRYPKTEIWYGIT